MYPLAGWERKIEFLQRRSGLKGEPEGSLVKAGDNPCLSLQGPGKGKSFYWSPVGARAGLSSLAGIRAA